MSHSQVAAEAASGRRDDERNSTPPQPLDLQSTPSRKRSGDEAMGSEQRSHAHSKCFDVRSSSCRTLRGSYRLMYERQSSVPAGTSSMARTYITLPFEAKQQFGLQE